ncbi:hypothetical protein H0X10_00560 [Candidatus Saccharibacteria bacterium]|nr:hypothetical protein [Candidatus Saccharibacteria bacterium]
MSVSKDKFFSEELLEVHRILGWMDLVIGSINDAVCVVDKLGNIIFSNNYFANLLATQRIFLLGQSFNEAFPIKQTESPLPEYINIANNVTETLKGEEAVYEWTNKENNHLFFRVSKQILPNSEQIVYLIQNITSEYKLSLMKNNFINLASHQLRTPMTVIMTYAHMLSNEYAGGLNKEQQQLADTLVSSSERMIALVEGLLNIARVQSATRLIQKSDIRISEIFKQIHKELEPRLVEKKLGYSLSLDGNLPVINTDTSIFHEIFSNLIVNAVQYTPIKGSINVTVKLMNKKALISISDTGIGIPKEYQPYLFEQFSRAENAMQEFTEGTGLGLYMVKILLDKIGGTINYRSELNVGTEFKVLVPLT